VWLSAPTGGSPEQWVDVVADNHLVGEGIFEGRHVWVDWPKSGGQIVVFVGGVSVLRAHISGAGYGEITGLELRPLGLDIHGTPSGLYVSSNLFSKNTFENVTAMIDIG
jgi:hypothetical protein